MKRGPEHLALQGGAGRPPRPGQAGRPGRPGDGSGRPDRTGRASRPGRWKQRLLYGLLALALALGLAWKALRVNVSVAAVNLAQTVTGELVEYPAGDLPDALTFDRLEVKKAERRMMAYSRGRLVRVYVIALGENPVGRKRYEGDRKTPEGKYTINGKNPNSAYYKNLGISYPDAQDRKAAAALGKSPGGDIKIHGLAPEFASLGKAHRNSDWTWGCIAVTNEEMEELYNRTPIGIGIEIKP